MGKRTGWTEERKERERRSKREREARDRRLLNPGLPPYQPKALRGPSDSPSVPDGHELAGISTLRGPDGVERTWEKTRVAGTEPTPLPAGFDLPSRISIMARGDGSEVVRWASYDRAKLDLHAELMAAWDRHAERYAGLVAPTVAPEHTESDTLAFYPVGDHHLGMLSWWRETGESWDLAHGVSYLLAAVNELVRLAPPAEEAVIANLGDFTHAQDQSARTPGHGNRLDVDGRQAKVRDAALTLLVGVADAALKKHKRVTFHHIPGNHDPEIATALAREMRAWYRNEPRLVVADAYRQHQYFRFGSNLFGLHHGDSTPASELPGIMAVDEREAWGETEFHWWHCGHVHHKIKDKEHPGCVIETHRILPPGDAWHVGRYRAGRGMSVIAYDRKYGEASRAIVGVERVRQILAQNRAA